MLVKEEAAKTGKRQLRYLYLVGSTPSPGSLVVRKMGSLLLRSVLKEADVDLGSFEVHTRTLVHLS